MATYEDAAIARELIRNVALFNNQAVERIEELVALRAKLLALPSARQTEIADAVNDMGYDATEVVTMLNRWHQLATSGLQLGIEKVPLPQ